MRQLFISGNLKVVLYGKIPTYRTTFPTTVTGKEIMNKAITSENVYGLLTTSRKYIFTVNGTLHFSHDVIFIVGDVDIKIVPRSTDK